MLSKFSVKKPMTILVAVILIIGLGFLSFTKLKTDLLPSTEFPFVIIMTTYPGASPERVEENVTKPLESAVSTVSGVENITSTSSENSSMIMLELDYATNMDSAIIEINTQIDMVEGMLDEGVIAPMVIKMNPDMMPVMMLGASYEGKDLTELSTELSENIIPELERVHGVGALTASGLVEEQIEVKLNNAKIEEINEEILSGLDSQLSTAMAQIEAGEKQLEALNESLAKQMGGQQDQLTTEQKNLIDQIAQLEAGITPLEYTKTQLSTELATVERQKATLEAQIGGGTPTTEQQALLDSYNASIDSFTIQIDAVDQQLTPLMKTHTELEKALIDMSAGKDSINSAYIDLRAQIAVQESLLQSQKADFESQKNEALESAGIEGLLTAEMVSNILMAQNFSMPAGYISDGDEELSLKIGEAFTSSDEMKNLVIMDTGSTVVRLGDIATVDLVEKREDIYAKVNGEDAIMISIQKQSSISTADLSKNLNEEMDSLEEEYKGLALIPMMDQGIYIDIIIGSVINNLILGGIFAVLILYFFLRNIRPTLVVSLSIPISIMFAIVLMYFSGVDLNMISLSGLALGVGMLLDNSIVVIENIFRMRSEGVPALKAAVAGAKEVSGAIVASTLTTICVFMPILFTDGLSRQLFMDMGLTIAYSLIASLVVALTVVPSLSASLLKKELKPSGKIFEKTLDGYKKLLEKALKRRIVVVGVSIVLLVASAGIAAQTGMVFIPESDSEEMTATFALEDEELSKEEGRAIIDDLVDEILKIESIEKAGALQAGMMGPTTDTSLYIGLKADRDQTSQEVASEIGKIAEDYPVEATISSSSMDMTALTGSGIQVKILGNDLEQLVKISNDLKRELSEVEGVAEVTNGQEDATEEKRIIVDKDAAAKYGLTVAQVYQEVTKALEVEQDATILSADNEDYQVVVVKDEKDVLTNDQLEDYIITAETATGEQEVELGKIAMFETAEGLTSIAHEGLSRVMTVSATVDEGHNVTLVARDIEAALEDFPVPEGYELEYGGENEMIMETMIDLVTMILVAVAFVYLIMVAQFQTLLSPFIIMFTMPLAFTGGFLALVLTGNEISTVAMLGFVMLSGIVVNNGIVFVDYTNKLRGNGMEKREAILTAGARRLRPIVMTALTTVLGLSTLALGLGTGTDMISPMAIVVIGGLLYATIMTLFVVPVMYDLLYRKEFKIVKDEDLEEIKELDKI